MDSVFQMIQLYQSTIVAGAVAAMCLSWIGAHLTARNQTMQIFGVGQGAILGVLLSLWLMPELGQETHLPGWLHLLQHSLPILSSFAVGAFVFWITRKMARTLHSGRDAFFASVFVIVSALGFLLSGLVPGLEGQMAQSYFGDLATLNKHDAWILIGLSLAVGGYLWHKRWDLLSESFHHSVFDRRKSILTRSFDWLSLAVIAFSVQYCGFLFTIAFLFLPTTVFRSQGNYVRHLRLIALWAGASSILGFVLSLIPLGDVDSSFGHTPTVPAMVGVCSLGSLIFWRTLWRQQRRPRRTG